VRRLHSYVKKYGPEAGPKLYHLLQSQAAHASVSARLRRKIDVLTGKAPAPAPVVSETPVLPEMTLFPGLDAEPEPAAEDQAPAEPQTLAVGA